MATLNQLQERSHRTARDKGWWDKYVESSVRLERLHFPNVLYVVEEKVALVHSEISEALEDYRTGKMKTELLESGKPVGFPTELADVVIRWMDLFGALGIQSTRGDEDLSTMSERAYDARRKAGWFVREDLDVATRGDDSVVAQTLCKLHMSASREAQAFGTWTTSACGRSAYTVITDALALGYHLNLDMEKEISAKQDYNDSRSYRHGGKRV